MSDPQGPYEGNAGAPPSLGASLLAVEDGPTLCPGRPCVFVSHAHEDAPFVERELVPLLRDSGLETWYAKEDIKSAELWEKSIRDGLGKSHWFLLVMSPRSAASTWVARELHWAMEHRVGRIVPVLLEKHELGSWHLGLGQIERIDFSEDLERARQRLRAVWGPCEQGKARSSATKEEERECPPSDQLSDRRKGVVSETVRTAAPASSARKDACLVHIYPSGPSMGCRYALNGVPVVIGRGTDCGIQIGDHSISRRHARIVTAENGFEAVDLESTNGTYVNNVPVARGKLKDGDSLRIGNCLFRFFCGENVEKSYLEEVYRLAILDGLTDLHNKRYLLEFLDRELFRSVRWERPLALVLFDLDHFKEVNDQQGHLCGDHILREVPNCVKGSIKKDELLARYGGDEFAIVLPEADLEGAVRVAEHCRSLIAQHQFQFDGLTHEVTVSVGVVATGGEQDMTPAQFLQKADEKLYQAKKEGRNCVRAAPCQGPQSKRRRTKRRRKPGKK